MAKRKTMGLVAVEGDAENRVACFRCKREQATAKPPQFPFDAYNSDPEAEQHFELQGAPGSYKFRRLTGPTTDSIPRASRRLAFRLSPRTTTSKPARRRATAPATSSSAPQSTAPDGPEASSAS